MEKMVKWKNCDGNEIDRILHPENFLNSFANVSLQPLSTESLQ